MGCGIVLMGDPRVTGIQVSDNGEDLDDIRDRGLRVSSLRADDAGDFAHVRAGLATRQRLYFDDYLSSLRGATPDADEERLRMLTSRYVSPQDRTPGG